MTALLDLVWDAARITFIATVPLMGLAVLVFAVKESRREYRKARQLEALTLARELQRARGSRR
jgi:hypothetical protein